MQRLIAIVCSLVMVGLGPIWAQEASHPSSLSGTSLEILGAEQAASFADSLPVNKKVKWRVFVPKSYDPAVPAGLFVYISPSSSGRMPGRWKGVMEEKNLIFIAANQSGNKTKIVRRMLHASMAPRLAAENFTIDPERIYVSGFSGGGRTASHVATLFPEMFKGGIYMCGVNYASLTPPKPQFHERRHVLLTGHQDFNRRETKAVYAAMQAGGATELYLMDIPGFAHELPRAKQLAEAIAFLDTGVAPD